MMKVMRMLHLGYAPHRLYAGHPHQFQRHYYGSIGELENKGEEYECAKAHDMTGKVPTGKLQVLP
jgi:hypothetical protein